MTGHELKQLILGNGRTVDEVAKMLGMSRAGLYNQLARDNPKKYYVLAVKNALGLGAD